MPVGDINIFVTYNYNIPDIRLASYVIDNAASYMDVHTWTFTT